MLSVHPEEVVAHEGEDGEAVLEDVVGHHLGALTQHFQRQFPNKWIIIRIIQFEYSISVVDIRIAFSKVLS